MKLILKEYWIHICILILLLGTIFYSFNKYYTYHLEQQNARSKLIQKYCYERDDAEEMCDNMKFYSSYLPSYFPALNEIISLNNIPIGTIFIVLVILPTAYVLTRYLKSGSIFNDSNRISFAKIKNKIFKKSYVSVVVCAIFFLVLFIGVYFISDGFSLVRNEIDSIPWKESVVQNPLLFITFFLTYNILLVATYVNIVLVIARKYHNFFICTILSFLTIIGIELFFEIVVDGILFGAILKMPYGIIFNIMSGLTSYQPYGLLPSFLFALGVFTISFIFVHYMYKDKEKLIIDCEVGDK